MYNVGRRWWCVVGGWACLFFRLVSRGLEFVKFPQAFLNLTLWHQGFYAVAVLLTVAFRNDYPFNLTVVLFSMYYCGWIHGMKEACV